MSDLAAAAAPPTVAPPRRITRRLLRNRLAVLGVFVLAALVLLSAFGPYAVPYDDQYIDILHRFAPPFAGPHILGTDPLGRDMLARLMMAGRVSLTVGFSAMVISTAVGVVVGAVSGFYGGWIGTVLMRIVDAMLCFPTIFLLLAIAAFLNADLITITLVIAATAWMEVARLVDAQFRTLKNWDFTIAAEALGASDAWIIFRELVPNAMAPLVVTAALQIARAILLESYISFLGYGIQPPTPTWGNMLKDSQEYLDSAPWLAILPGLAITLAVTSFNFLGDGLRDALDPRLSQR
jgi:peptide/nickel transport system permease protein